MNERLPNERGNTSIKAIIVSSLLFCDVVPQPSECGDRKVGRGFKSALMQGVVREYCAGYGQQQANIYKKIKKTTL
jgi:hypothetical protein